MSPLPPSLYSRFYNPNSMMISRSNGVMRRLRSGINGCDAKTIAYTRRRAVKEKQPMAAGEAVSLPVVARECVDCKTMTTPLWRSGPGGPKSLCNACGIKFSKSRIKSEPEADYSEKSSCNEKWEELKRRQKEKQQKLLLILLQQQRDEAKNRKQMNTISRSRLISAASAFGEVEKKKKRSWRTKRGCGGWKGDREAEAAALLLLSLSSTSASASYF